MPIIQHAFLGVLHLNSLGSFEHNMPIKQLLAAACRLLQGLNEITYIKTVPGT